MTPGNLESFKDHLNKKGWFKGLRLLKSEGVSEISPKYKGGQVRFSQASGPAYQHCLIEDGDPKVRHYSSADVTFRWSDRTREAETHECELFTILGHQFIYFVVPPTVRVFQVDDLFHLGVIPDEVGTNRDPGENSEGRLQKIV
jgi:hypothetical protein